MERSLLFPPFRKAIAITGAAGEALRSALGRLLHQHDSPANRHAVAEEIELRRERVQVGTSVGVATRKSDSTPDEITREAVVAMNAAKSKGKNRIE